MSRLSYIYLNIHTQLPLLGVLWCHLLRLRFDYHTSFAILLFTIIWYIRIFDYYISIRSWLWMLSYIDPSVDISLSIDTIPNMSTNVSTNVGYFVSSIQQVHILRYTFSISYNYVYLNIWRLKDPRFDTNWSFYIPRYKMST